MDWTRIAIEGCTTALLLAITVGIATRLPRRWRVVAYTVALALGLQYLLLGNPVAWHVYAELLSPEEVGWRQYSVILKQRDQYVSQASRVEYLAVGSSQTDALYSGYASEHEQFTVFEMAAMAPLDFVLYRDQIQRYHPGHILLYLSDFDIAREQPPESVAMAPSQGLYLFDLWATIRSQGTHAYDQALVDMAFGEVFSAYKYRFVFRALSDKVLLRMSRILGRDERTARQRDSLEQRIGFLRESIGAEYIAFNMTFLREFLEDTSATGTQVVVVEGQYNPLVSTAETLKLKKEVRDEVEALCASFEHARFLPAESAYVFSEEDYMDLSHVKPEAGYLFTARLVALLGGSVP